MLALAGVAQWADKSPPIFKGMGEAPWDSQLTTFFGAGSLEAPGDSGTTLDRSIGVCFFAKTCKLAVSQCPSHCLKYRGDFFRE